MAQLDRDGQDLVVRLSTVEKAEAVHGDVRVPMSAVRSVEVVDDAVHAVNAFAKSVGAALPGRFMIGTFRADGKTFVVVHHSTPRGVRVRLEGANFDELLIGCDDPEGTVDRLGAGDATGS
jgi:hypothetical protein